MRGEIIAWHEGRIQDLELGYGLFASSATCIGLLHTKFGIAYGCRLQGRARRGEETGTKHHGLCRGRGHGAARPGHGASGGPVRRRLLQAQADHACLGTSPGGDYDLRGRMLARYMKTPKEAVERTKTILAGVM